MERWSELPMVTSPTGREEVEFFFLWQLGLRVVAHEVTRDLLEWNTSLSP